MSYPKRTFIPLGALLVAAFAVGAESVGATGHAGDFNGDGADDVLLRHLHSDSWRFYTLVDDVPVAHDLAIPADPAWRFVATGDFDGNGYDDVLLRNVDTLASVYHAVTADGVEERAISLTKNPLYDFLGTGDFDGDGKDEVLIRRNQDYGVWFYYDVEGTRATLRRDSGATQNLAWDFAGIGDFDGDGRDDILIRHSEFLNWIYYEMNGTTARAVLRRPGITRNPLFTFHAVADITGDGRDDVMLRNTKSREWIYYAMTGPRALLQRPPGMTRNPRWTLHAIGDFDGSGRATPLIRLSVSGGWALYDIQGLEAQVVHFPGMSREQTWAAVGTLPTSGNPAALSRIEFLQGPPTFRKDYRAGEVIGPINASRPENSGVALESWTWDVSRVRAANGQITAEQYVWSAANQGFVTSIWKRRVAIAVEATHVYRHPAPTVSVELVTDGGEAVSLSALLDVTDPHPGHAYRTELVFDLPAELNQPGGEILARVTFDGEIAEEALPLFGETVTRLPITWFPLATPDFPAPEVDPQAYVSYALPYLPIAEYHATLGPQMIYQSTGAEEDGAIFDRQSMIDQAVLHHATHACTADEIYMGVYNRTAILAAGRNIGIGGWFWRHSARASVGSVPDDGGNPLSDHVATVAHELGHALDLPHAPCGREGVPYPPDVDPDYPYDQATLGPSRGWHFGPGEFVDRQTNRRDVLSYCLPRFISDYNYQHALTFLQSQYVAGLSAEVEDCMDAPGGRDGDSASLALVGHVGPDGTVTVTGAALSSEPPWAPPDTMGTPGWTVSLQADDGTTLYEQQLHLDPPYTHEYGTRPAHPEGWSARIPYSAAASKVTLADPIGNVSTSRDIGSINVRARPGAQY